MPFDRRSFLKRSCLAAGALAAGPKWLAAGLFERRLSSAADTILVVVQMAGGNDWLNTVVPIADSTYRTARPRVALSPSQTLRVDSRTGLHPNLGNLHRHLNAGRLAIVQGVGYEGPDLSHFNSMEIWHRASRTPKATGWLGDTLDQLYAGDANGLHALAVGGDVPPSFESREVSTTVLHDPEAFDFPMDPYYPDDDPIQRAAFRASLMPIGNGANDLIANVGSVALRDAAGIKSAVAAYTPAVTYPEGDLANGLKLVASVISSNLGPRIFWVTQDGDYDTHDSQRGAHDDLLKALDIALDAFYRDLEAHEQAQRVVLMTWSEFGRRVEDNGSGGTDHGAAGGLFVLGSRVRGGLFGAPSSLSNLDSDGNLQSTTDFRSIYASILRNWIGADPGPILNGNYPTLSFL